MLLVFVCVLSVCMCVCVCLSIYSCVYVSCVVYHRLSALLMRIDIVPPSSLYLVLSKNLERVMMVVEVDIVESVGVAVAISIARIHIRINKGAKQVPNMPFFPLLPPPLFCSNSPFLTLSCSPTFEIV